MNKTLSKILKFFVLAIVISGISGCGYNRLVNLDEEVNRSWSNVENVMQRRLDLIPNLVNTVKGYASHEKEVLEAVTNARARVGSAETIKDKMEADKQLTSALGRLMVVMENYPDLKADKSFLNLQEQLEGTENRIAVERRRYNDAVAAYNKATRQFPTVLFAKMFGFERKESFKADKEAQKAPEVKF